MLFGEVGSMAAKPERVYHHLWQWARSGPELFLCAIVDTARDPSIRRRLAESDTDSWCLIGDDISLELSEAAPYLVIFEEGSALLKTLIEKGWGHSWGIFMIARPPFDALLDHLKSILTARLPEGESVYFRYYDPRVLRLYLPTCTEEELDRFFGPVTSCIMEADADGRLAEFWRGGEDDPEAPAETTHFPSGLCQLIVD